MGDQPIPLSELERELIALGYDLDSLDRDNPHSQWQYALESEGV